MDAAKKVLEVKEKAMEAQVTVLKGVIASKTPAPIPRALHGQLEVLRNKVQAVVEAQEKVMQLYYEDADDKTTEILAVEEKRSKFQLEYTMLESEVMEKIVELTPSSSSTVSTSAAAAIPKADPHRLNLPKMKLPEFGGDVRDYLGFWAAFSHIDADTAIPEAEKFHYLLQCITPNSDARKAIDSFPVIAKNYRKAVDTLKARFGKTNMLVKVYVRDLLQIVIQNAIDTKKDFPDLVSQLSSKIQNLAELGVTSDKCEAILYPVLESCIPEDILEKWQHQAAYSEKIDDLMVFLNAEVQRTLERSLTRMSFGTTGKKNKNTKEGGYSKEKDVATVTGFMNASDKPRKEDSCIFCNGKHASLECRKAGAMPLQDKLDLIKKKGCCFTCLRIGHSSRKCRSYKFIKCQKCEKHHNVLICPDMHSDKTHSSDSADKSASNSKDSASSKDEVKGDGVVSFVNQVQRKEVLLETLTVAVSGKAESDRRPTRAVFDRCSQSSYILESVAKELKLPVVGQEVVNHHTFGGNISKPTTHNIYRIYVTSLDGGTVFTFEVSGSEKISSTIHGVPKGEWVTLCTSRGIKLTDLSPLTPDIELMIGADVGARLYTGRKLDMTCGPTASETQLGWVISGKLPIPARTTQSSTMSVVNMHILDETVSKMWDLELIGITDSQERQSKKEIDQSTMDHFKKTVKRLDDGRYEINFPWIKYHQQLPINMAPTARRLQKLIIELEKNGKLQEYHDIFMNWLKQGIIEEVPEKELTQECHYIAHRAVYKESSTTPTRPVFDASAKSKNFPSLNDCLATGPNLLELIPSVFTRFRLEKVGVVADIAKAFLQISVTSQDRNYLRFLWYSDLTTKKIVEYRHCRVVFGVSSSPFLLGATLRYHLENAQENKVTAVKLLESMYVDNCATSLKSLEEARQFMEISQKLLLPAKFDLRGWEFGPVDKEKLVPVLGLLWNTHTDTLQFDLVNAKKRLQGPATKRQLLSFANMIFDPLGFAAPFTVHPKLLFKKSCEYQLDWDTELPDDLARDFNKWKGELLKLEDVKIPRWVAQQDADRSNWSMHVFCDASTNLYATSVFLRVAGEITTVQLLEAKSRVRPKKPMTIPRMELMACLIGARLSCVVKDYLLMPDIPTFYRTDSTTALAWIRNNGNWGPFVGNRVDEIRRLTDTTHWHHVPGEYNPADLPSRGCSANALLRDRWWEGPSWLKLESDKWPRSGAQPDQIMVDAERRKTVVTAMTLRKAEHPIDRLLKYSDYHKILRVMSVVLRFIKNLKKQRGLFLVRPEMKNYEESTLEEITEAERVIIQYVQRSSFSGIDDARLRKFRPFVDAHGVIRMESRLVLGDDEESFKRPIILPGENGFVKRMIWKEHTMSSHAGTGTVLAILRDRYWILNGRRTISNVLLACIKCRRLLGKNYKVQEAPLPANRIKKAKAFEITGVDLMGPLYLRGKEKVWVALYTCAVYRAVHLEIVKSLSTADFIQSLIRFVSRRGRPSVIYSDNGTNFVGCANLFKSVDWKEVQRTAAVERMEWRFNPPAAP